MSIYKTWSIRKLTPYEKKKSLARQLAYDWQLDHQTQPHSWQWCIDWYARWERIGRKYGLIREFKENGIL